MDLLFTDTCIVIDAAGSSSRISARACKSFPIKKLVLMKYNIVFLSIICAIIGTQFAAYNHQEDMSVLYIPP